MGGITWSSEPLWCLRCLKLSSLSEESRAVTLTMSTQFDPPPLICAAFSRLLLSPLWSFPFPPVFKASCLNTDHQKEKWAWGGVMGWRWGLQWVGWGRGWGCLFLRVWSPKTCLDFRKMDVWATGVLQDYRMMFPPIKVNYVLHFQLPNKR